MEVADIIITIIKIISIGDKKAMEAVDSRELSTEVEQGLPTQCKNTDKKKRAVRKKTGDANEGAEKTRQEKQRREPAQKRTEITSKSEKVDG